MRVSITTTPKPKTIDCARFSCLIDRTMLSWISQFDFAGPSWVDAHAGGYRVTLNYPENLIGLADEEYNNPREHAYVGFVEHHSTRRDGSMRVEKRVFIIPERDARRINNTAKVVSFSEVLTSLDAWVNGVETVRRATLQNGMIRVDVPAEIAVAALSMFAYVNEDLNEICVEIHTRDDRGPCTATGKYRQGAVLEICEVAAPGWVDGCLTDASGYDCFELMPDKTSWGWWLA